MLPLRRRQIKVINPQHPKMPTIEEPEQLNITETKPSETATISGVGITYGGGVGGPAWQPAAWHSKVNAKGRFCSGSKSRRN